MTAGLPIEVAYISFDSNTFGSERSLLSLLTQLDPKKIRPRLILTRPGPLEAAAQKAGLTPILLPWLEGPFRPWQPQTPIATVKLALWLRAHGIDVVELNRLSFGHLAIIGLAARLAGCRVIVRVRMSGSKISWLQKLTLLLTDLVLSVSESSIAPWRQGWLPKALERRLLVTLPSRDIESLKLLKADRSLLSAIGIPDRATVVGIVGAITPNKRQDLFLKTAEALLAEFPEAWFVILGGALDEETPAYVARLQRFLEGKPLDKRVIFTGHRDDAALLMKNFDLLVMPSEREGIGGTLIEAMALGVPIVAHRVDGIPEAVTHGKTGLLVDEQQSRLYAQACASLLKDGVLAARLRQAALQDVERFDNKKAARWTEATYEALTRPAASAATTPS